MSRLYMSPFLSNICRYIMQNARLDEARLELRSLRDISIASDPTDNTTLMTESEELKRLLMKVKEESEKVGSKLFRKLRSWHPVPSLHDK